MSDAQRIAVGLSGLRHDEDRMITCLDRAGRDTWSAVVRSAVSTHSRTRTQSPEVIAVPCVATAHCAGTTPCQRPARFRTDTPWRRTLCRAIDGSAERGAGTTRISLPRTA